MATDATTVAPVAVQPAEIRRPAAGLWSDALWRLRHDPTTIAALVVLATMVTLALGADLLADNFFHWSFSKQDILSSYEKPSLSEPAMWLGSDQLGRSQIVRLLYGARVSLFIGTFGAATSMLIGVVLGVTAGYFRGWWDDLVVWLVTTLNSIPTLFLLLIVGLLFRLAPLPLAVFLGALGWLGIANLARGQTISLREREYVLAARTVGATPIRVMWRHIFPNILPLMIILAMTDIGGLILTESALSYLGFGIQPPVPSWGNMLTGATQFLTKGPWLVYAPGAMIWVTVLCLYLVGDGLRDALDPRLRGVGRSARK
ncbi:MAG TPA: ABC transporter permease [Candidatus Limnocylindria bacterium]|nr:ABC transporter permease [Candidatus Limnocylindria bacterium]